MISKDNLDFLGRLLCEFETAAKETAESRKEPYKGLRGVQFLDKDGDSAFNTLMLPTGAIRVKQVGRLRSSLSEGSHFSALPKAGGELSLSKDGFIVSNTGTEDGLGTNAPSTLAIKGLASQLFFERDNAFSGTYIKCFDGTNYMYTKGRNMYVIGAPLNGVSKAQWLNLSSTVPECIMQVDKSRFLTRRLFNLFRDVKDTVVRIFQVNENIIISLSSDSLKVSVAHVAGTPDKDKDLILNFSIRESTFRLTKTQEELKLEEVKSMDINQVSQLFGSYATKPADPVLGSTVQETTTTTDKSVESVPAEAPAVETPETVEEVVSEPITEPVSEQPATMATELPSEEPVKEPTTVELLEELIASIDGIKTQAAAALKPCKEACKRVKKLEKNPPKTGLEERIKELEAELAQVKSANAKLKKALDAAIAG